MDDFRLKVLEGVLGHAATARNLLPYVGTVFNKKSPPKDKTIMKPLQEVFIEKLSKETDEGFVISLKEEYNG